MTLKQIYTNQAQSSALIQNTCMLSHQHRKSYYGDNTVIRSFYFHSGNSYAGKTASLYWISIQMALKYCVPYVFYKFCESKIAEPPLLLAKLRQWHPVVHWFSGWVKGIALLSCSSEKLSIRRLLCFRGHRGTKDQQCVPFWFPVLLVWISCWTNSRVGTDLRRHDVHITPWCSYNTDSVAKQGQNFDKFMHRRINSRGWEMAAFAWCVDVNMQEKT